MSTLRIAVLALASLAAAALAGRRPRAGNRRHQHRAVATAGQRNLPFLDRRYPAARFTEVNEDYRHQHQDVRVEDGVQYGDLLQFVDFDYITRVARVNAATLAGLASAPGTMSGVRVHTSQLSVDTDLEWDASPDPDLAG